MDIGLKTKQVVKFQTIRYDNYKETMIIKKIDGFHYLRIKCQQQIHCNKVKIFNEKL